uniref:GED domain-containing protein n=1 Tax=Romanomermis culicivorax TaxID=13658 RepID=A0A915HK13_ROMCU
MLHTLSEIYLQLGCAFLPEIGDSLMEESASEIQRRQEVMRMHQACKEALKIINEIKTNPLTAVSSSTSYTNFNSGSGSINQMSNGPILSTSRSSEFSSNGGGASGINWASSMSNGLTSSHNQRTATPPDRRPMLPSTTNTSRPIRPMSSDWTNRASEIPPVSSQMPQLPPPLMPKRVAPPPMNPSGLGTRTNTPPIPARPGTNFN